MNASSNWIPYKIPPTPVAGQNDFYTLSFSQGANPSTNPSKFLQWKNIDLSAILQRLSAIEDRLSTIENRLNSASISATCQGGSLDITLNI